MKIACVVYPDFTALDLVGPYEVISRWPDAEVHFLAGAPDPVRTDRGLTVLPTDTPQTLPDPDLIIVPGSGNPLPVLDDHVLLDWLRAAAPGCQWTASVCTGAGLYAAAGLLEGKATTTHWGFRDVIRAYGVEVVDERVVWQGSHVSAAGVSAGIDLALALTDRVHGTELAKALQLVIEYDPQPPFDSGSRTKADTDTRRLAMSVLMAGQPRVKVAAKMARTIMGARLGRARRALSGQHASSRRPVEHVRQEQSLSGGPAEPAPTDAPVASGPRDQSG
jgi:transcriptional regulator GlxA family with amidase domain